MIISVSTQMFRVLTLISFLMNKKDKEATNYEADTAC